MSWVKLKAVWIALARLLKRVVIAREDTPGDKRLIAYIVTKPGLTLDRTALGQFFSKHLPSFMVPSVVVELPEMPKNPNGKIDRKALPIPTAEIGSEVTERTIVSARSPLEKQLVALWCSVLNVETVGVTENFFELGGHSLLVMRLFSELEATFNRRLPLVEIFAAPTVEQMAKRLEEILATVPQTEAAIEGEEALVNSCLTLLKKGTANNADCPPLFMMHDVVGDVGLYIHLARRLGGKDSNLARSVYGVKPQPGSGANMVHSRITEIAQHCVEQMRSVQPSEPYLLGGLCAGGVIAFEAALQLEALGEAVHVFLLDAPAPTAQKRTDLISNQRKAGLSQVLSSQTLLAAAKTLWKKGTNVIRYEASNKIEQTKNAIEPRLFRWYQDRGWTIPKFLQQLSVHDLFMFAYGQYRPSRKLQSKLLLIRATQGNGTKADAAYISQYEDSHLGWDDWTAQPVEICDVPGGHSTMLNDRNAQALAQAIDTFLETTTNP